MQQGARSICAWLSKALSGGAGVLEAGFADYLRAFTDGPSPAELVDREGLRRQPFLKRSLPPAVSFPRIHPPAPACTRAHALLYAPLPPLCASHGWAVLLF